MTKADQNRLTGILYQAYDHFLLPLGGKKVPTPYRRNVAGSYQKVGPEFQGKSSSETLTKTTLILAKQQSFDLDKASVEEIRQFMRQNMLGIDCSGFAYRMLDFLVQKLGMGNLQKTGGFDHVGRTNIAKLTSDENTIAIKDFSQTQPGDIIKLNSTGDILHGLIVIENGREVITYTHSSGVTKPEGVHMGQIINSNLAEELKVFRYDPKAGDGIRRLKILL